MIDVLLVIAAMTRDLHRMGRPSRILVSESMKEAFREYPLERYKRIMSHDVLPMGDLYFRGIPVECCESLSDEEYAFVNRECK